MNLRLFPKGRQTAFSPGAVEDVVLLVFLGVQQDHHTSVEVEQGRRLDTHTHTHTHTDDSITLNVDLHRLVKLFVWCQ